jgi:ribonuclease E
VENRLRDALRQDRARVQFGTISKFGLMEMSRQRLRPALSEGASIPCPRCGGSGHIRDTESSALQILRIIQEESLKDNTASVLCQVPVEVASFLLNEKRAEIAKIEIKQRINVLMVPNKTLETPNYKLERLKHDDPRLDNVEPSYKMAEEAEDAVAVTRRSQEPTNKQTPVIKGVLPDAPAPVAIPKPELPKPVVAAPRAATRPVAPAPAPTGFFGWLKNLLAPAPVPVAPAKPSAAADDKREGRPSRDGARRNEPRGEGRDDVRSGRGGRPEGRGGRGGRGPRTDRPAQGQRERIDADGRSAPVETSANLAATPASAVDQGTAERPPRNPGRERGNRGEPRADTRAERRPDRNRRPDETPRSDSAGTESAGERAEAPTDALAPTEGTPVRERRPRDRYGRDRTARTERAEQGDQQEQATAAAQQEFVEEPRRSYFTTDNRTAVPALPVTPQAEAPESQVEVPLVTTVIPAPTAKVDAVAMPKLEAFSLPLDELAQIAASSGLTWVNSDAARIAAVQAAIAAEPKQIHIPRERPAMVQVDTAPLILVETKRNLRTMELPFEAPQ